MTFANPFGLIGLLSLPVILALHLLFKRRRRYVVSHLGLWSFLNSELAGPRSRRLPFTWILLLDLLIAALVSVAWAQPRIAVDWTQNSPKHRIILLDVSSSMLASDGAAPGGPTRFERAKDITQALLEGVRARDEVTVLTFGRQAAIIADSRDGRQASLAELAEQVRLAQAGETGSGGLLEALALGQAALEPSRLAEYHVVTDGGLPAESLAVLAEQEFRAEREFQGGLPVRLNWHFVGGPVQNQAVTDLNAVPLGEDRFQVFARIANFSDAEVSREVVLEVNGRPVGQEAVVLPANTQTARVWQIAAQDSRDAGEAAEVVVSLRGADSLVQDDSAALALHQGGVIRVGLVESGAGPEDGEAQSAAALRQAVQAIPGAALEVVSAQEYEASLAGDTQMWDLAIFRNYLPAAWPPGQSLVVDLPLRVNSDSAGLHARSRVNVPAGQHLRAPADSPYVEGIDFNGVRWAGAWSVSPPPGFTPLLTAGEIPLLLEGSPGAASPGAGRVIVMAADLARGNLIRHPAFPVLIANIIERARQAPLPSGIQTGEPVELPLTARYASMQVIPPQQPVIHLQAPWPPAWRDTLDPGFYRFRLVQEDGQTTEFTAGARAGDSVESDLRPRDAILLAAENGLTAPAAPIEDERQLDLQGWLLGAALLALFVETFLAWRR